jgi:hypothetical protein
MQHEISFCALVCPVDRAMRVPEWDEVRFEDVISRRTACAVADRGLFGNGCLIDLP